MKIKSFIAPGLEEAVALIQNEIGSSALILEIKDCEGKGFKGFLGKTMIEVVAAYPDEDSASDGIEGRYMEMNANEEMVGRSENVEKNCDNKVSRSRMLSILNERINRKQDDEVSEKVVDSNLSNIKDQSVDLDLEAEKEVSDADDSSYRNFSQIFEDLNAGITGNLTPAIEEVKNKLLDQELDEKVINRFLKIEENTGISEFGTIDTDAIKADVREQIAKTINVKNIIDDSDKSGGNRIITFVGPTGVGKTTTLAKVAAKLAFDNNKEVGVITIDTYRIAAVDQLMAYTEMINIPIKVAYTVKELVMAVNGYRDKDFVLIDTVGRGQYDEKRIGLLKDFLEEVPSSENYLVMNAGTRNRESTDIYESFNVMPLQGFIFTKIDETRTFGMMHNISTKTELPICFLTNGQEVPDDIVESDPGYIANLIVADSSGEKMV